MSGQRVTRQLLQGKKCLNNIALNVNVSVSVSTEGKLKHWRRNARVWVMAGWQVRWVELEPENGQHQGQTLRFSDTWVHLKRLGLSDLGKWKVVAKK